MTTHCGNLQGALCLLLTPDLRQVRILDRGRRQVQALEWGQQGGAVEVFADLEQVFRGIDGKAAHQGRLVRVLARQDECPSRIPCRQGRRQDAGHRAQVPREGELPEQLQTTEQIALELTGRTQDTRGDGQVEAFPFFGQVHRGQVDGHAADRKPEAAVEQGTTHPLLALLDRQLGEADDRQRRQAPREMYLHGYGRGLEMPSRARLLRTQRLKWAL